MARKSCKSGYYYCYSSKKCKKIPIGYYVGVGGWLKKEKKDSEEKDKNENSENETSGGEMSEEWTKKYKESINCNRPKGFSQKAFCRGKQKKMNESKEKDHEISMAQSQLKKTEKNLKSLKKSLGKKEKNIPAWVQAKITDTEHNMDAAAGYMDEQLLGHPDSPYMPGNRNFDRLVRSTTNKSKKEKIDLLKSAAKLKNIGEGRKSGDYSLHDWFTKSRADDGTPGWRQIGGKYAGRPCARQPGQTTKPKCASSKMAARLSDKEEESAFRRKNIKDKNPNRKGKPINVPTEKIKIKLKDSYSNWRSDLESLDEMWGKVAIGAGAAAIPYLLKKFAKPAVDKEIVAPATGSKTLVDKLKQRRDATNKEIRKNSYEPEGELIDEKKDACYRKVKSRYKVWPSAYASGALVKCRKVGAKNWGNKSENFQDYNLKDEYIEENIIRAAKMAKNVIKALGKSKVRKSLPPINLKNLSPERKKEIMYQAQKRIKSYKPGEIDKSASRKYAADRLNTVYSRRQDVLKKGGSPKEAASQSISSMGPGDALGKDFNIKRGGRGRRGAHGPQTDRGKGNKSARRAGKEVTDTGNVNVHYRPTRDQSIQRSRERRSMRSMERRLNRMQSNDRKAMKSMERRLNKMLNLNNNYNFSNWREDLYEDWQKVNKSDKTDGMSLAAVKAYRSENPGSKLKTAVTEKNPGPKRSKRRKSFCSRSEGQKNMHNIDCSKTPQKPICKARKRWRC